MSGAYSPAIVSEVELLLPVDGDGITHADIRKRVGRWAPVTLRGVIRQLVEEGRVERLGVHPGYRFRRVANRRAD